MKKVEIYQVSIHNPDRTTIYVVAKNKMEATYKYGEWLKENGEEGWIDETTDFDIESVQHAYE